MMPRQPEVPKWIALLLIRDYCIVQRKSRRTNREGITVGEGFIPSRLSALLKAKRRRGQQDGS